MEKLSYRDYNSALYIDLTELRRNAARILAALEPQTALIPVLKDDAYGLGLTQIARVYARMERVPYIAVSHVSEGLLLRRAGVETPILVMGSALPFQLAAAVDAKLTLTIGRVGILTELEQIACERKQYTDIHVKIDTGLHRIGLRPGDALAAVLEEYRAAQHIRLTGTYSHFSDGDSAVQCALQYERFQAALAQMTAAGVAPGLRHISASAALERCPQYALDAVRIGRRLYMDHPTQPDGGVKELASWRTYITALNRLSAGETLGYAAAYTLPRDTTVAVLGVGYGDGLNTRLPQAQAPVLIRGRECPLLCCCMDQAFADVTGLDCCVGDEVTIFGYDREGHFLSAQAQSNRIRGNEGCGFTSALTSRVARVYESSEGERERDE